MESFNPGEFRNSTKESDLVLPAQINNENDKYCTVLWNILTLCKIPRPTHRQGARNLWSTQRLSINEVLYH